MTVFPSDMWLWKSNSFHQNDRYAGGYCHTPSEAPNFSTNIPGGRGSPLDSELSHHYPCEA